MTTQDIITRVLESEGGLSNHPSDGGGLTNFGITRATLSWYRNKPVSPEEMKTLTEQEAREIYLKLYVVNPGFDKVGDPLLRYQLVDFGVNSGPATAIKKLQEVLGIEPDGKLGPLTLRALDKADSREVANRLAAARLEMIAKFVAKKPSQVVFLVGWFKRAMKFFRM